MDAELETRVRTRCTWNILGEGWKENARKYIDKLEEEENETELAKERTIEENRR